MKTNVIGWLYLVVSTAFAAFFAFTLFKLFQSSSGYAIEATRFQEINQVSYLALAGLVLSIFLLIWGSALRKHRKWSWYAGIVLIPLLLIGNVIYLFSAFSILYLIALP